MTPKSDKHNTPIEVDVNLPFALKSLITAIAEAGDLATNMEPQSRET